MGLGQHRRKSRGSPGNRHSSTKMTRVHTYYSKSSEAKWWEADFISGLSAAQNAFTHKPWGKALGGLCLRTQLPHSRRKLEMKAKRQDENVGWGTAQLVTGLEHLEPKLRSPVPAEKPHPATYNL